MTWQLIMALGVGAALRTTNGWRVAPRRYRTRGGIRAQAQGEGSMDDIVGLCKRRGFIFQSSEIYNGFAGFYDYGPLGVEVKNNIKKAWWTDVVHRRDDVTGIDSSIIASPRVWKASGHIDGFSDPMVDCKETKLRYRADQLFTARLKSTEGEDLGYFIIQESDNMKEEMMKKVKSLLKKRKIKAQISPDFELKDLTEVSLEEFPLIPSPATDNPGDLTPPRDFNLMFQTSVGALADESAAAYLRPETAQGIFTNFKNVVGTGRMKVPFGIAQIGKAFRNEITPRNYIFRSREFEQMEVEYFIEEDDESWKKHHEDWISFSWNWLTGIGLKEEMMQRDVHIDEKLAHYARACTDIIFKFPFGWSELQGIAARGCYDLTKHQEESGKNLEYYDDGTKAKYLPHVIEPSIGVDRLFLALMCSAFDEDEINGEKRSVLRFHPRIAPIKAAVFPLVKNKPELVAKAKELHNSLTPYFNVAWDTAGAIGRRYRRMDEAGTPFCITVDFDTLEDDTVTIRDRDSTSQSRIPMGDVLSYIQKSMFPPIPSKIPESSAVAN